jgi:hypothetical protein
LFSGPPLMKTLCPWRIGFWLDVGALLDWLEVALLDWLRLELGLEVVRLEELVELELVDVPLVPVATVGLELVVFVELCEIVDDVAVGEDGSVIVRADDEADCVVVLLLDGTALLLADDVPLKLPVVVEVTELLEEVEVGAAVVVPLELPVVVLMTGLLEELEVRDAVVVPLNVKINEDEETEVDEVFDVAGAVGSEGPELLVLLPYGAPLEVELEENPPEGPVL